jgi:drug/metabolite transporter (DMT)-like permease
VLPTLLWGTSFVAIRVLLDEVSPFAAMTLRFALGSVGYLALLIWLHRGVPALPRRRIGRLLVVAVGGAALNSIGVNFAVQSLGAGISSLVIMLVPVLTGLLAVTSGQETITARKVQGFLIALAGLTLVVLLGGPDASLTGAKVIGLFLMIAGALGFAVYNVHVKPLFGDYSPPEVTAYVGILASLGLAPFFFFPGVPAELAAIGRLSSGGWLLALYLGVFSNIVAYVCWYWALGRLEATRVALFSYLIPIWGLASSALLLGERVTGWLAVGVALVAAGIVVSNRGAGGAGSPRP